MKASKKNLSIQTWQSCFKFNFFPKSNETQNFGSRYPNDDDFLSSSSWRSFKGALKPMEWEWVRMESLLPFLRVYLSTLLSLSVHSTFLHLHSDDFFFWLPASPFLPKKKRSERKRRRKFNFFLVNLSLARLIRLLKINKISFGLRLSFLLLTSRSASFNSFDKSLHTRPSFSSLLRPALRGNLGNDNVISESYA